ncbi:isorenieratene synthase [Nakamurella sp. UYEF19]|uniref:FAD-dependent oxidoreductase n=1 Tax=Nakamurella sp. UYEF19 TaxID=1756392 RepID=UPI0033970C16
MSSTWKPGRDRRAVRHIARTGTATPVGPARRVVVAGGGIAGLAAAAGLAERGVEVILVEKHRQLGGRVRSWPVADGPDSQDAQDALTMSRGFHAFFRQYYNLRSLLRRVDPALDRLTAVPDYPLVLAGGHADSFAKIPRTPPVNLAAFVARSPSFPLRDLTRVDIGAALELLDVDFPATFSRYDGESASQFLDRLRFPDGARHLALEVFARSFFAHPAEFSAGELVGMFHTYFVGSSEGLLFDVPTDDYDTALWAPLGEYLRGLGVQVLTERTVEAIDLSTPGVVTVTLADGGIRADAIVLATDPATTRRLVGTAPGLGDPTWRARIATTRNAPRFAVWRMWFDRPVAAERPAFLGTSGYGLLDNVTVLERFEAGAARWAAGHGGSVVELHAYALPDDGDDLDLQRQLRDQLSLVYPETTAAQVVSSQWLVSDDCPLVDASPWIDRPEVTTPDPRVVMAGDGLRCDLPVALMERAATTGWIAANTLLSGWGVAGHDLWTVPMRGRIKAMARLRKLLA